jgi:hypothetical protein
MQCLKIALKRQVEQRIYDIVLHCGSGACMGEFEIEQVEKDTEVNALQTDIYRHRDLRAFILQKRDNEELL